MSRCLWGGGGRDSGLNSSQMPMKGLGFSMCLAARQVSRPSDLQGSARIQCPGLHSPGLVMLICAGTVSMLAPSCHCDGDGDGDDNDGGAPNP